VPFHFVSGDFTISWFQLDKMALLGTSAYRFCATKVVPPNAIQPAQQLPIWKSLLVLVSVSSFGEAV